MHEDRKRGRKAGRRTSIEGGSARLQEEKGEMWVGQSSALPGAKQIDRGEESSPACCSADPINNIPIPVIH